jgi:2-keto-3-deoxy-L-rhamnonate aldolase RhmA
MQMGATFVAVGSDLGVLRMATQALFDKYRATDAAPIAAQY